MRSGPTSRGPASRLSSRCASRLSGCATNSPRITPEARAIATDAAVMIAEVRQRFHDDHFAHLKKGGRKLNVITTSDGHDKPAVHEIEEARPEPKATRKPSSRERLRELRRQLKEKE